MATLKFADTHNLVAFLSKSSESDEFEQISTVKIKTINGESQLHAPVDGKKIIITETSIRRDLQLADENGIDCIPNSAIFKQLALMGPKTTPWNEFSSNMASAIIYEVVHKELGDSSGPRCQETMGDTIAQTRFENVSKLSNDSLLARASVESSDDEESLGEDASKQGSIDAIDTDKEITLVSVFVGEDAGEEMLVAEQEDTVKDVAKEVVEVINTAKLIVDAAQVSTASTATTVSAATTTTADDLTLAQALQELKSTKPKMKGVVIQELVESITTKSSQQLQDKSQSHDKGKGILVEEPVKPAKKKDQIRLDEETALRLQAEFDEDERLAKEKDEANVALTEEWDDIQAKIKADHELAQRLQVEEQEELFVEEKENLFKQLLE
ncbi:hypothetical protein Tco_0523120 [Tanacetum coccineum]